MKPKNNYLILLIEIIIVLYTIWNRLLRVRILESLLDNISNIKIVIIIYTIRQIMNITPNKESNINRLLLNIQNNKYIIYMINIINTYIIEAPLTLFYFFYNRIRIKEFIFTSGSYVVYYLGSHIKLIDIIYFKQLNYFYKSLILFIILLIIDVYLFTCHILSERNMQYIEEYIKFLPGDYYYMNAAFKDKQPTFEGARLFSDLNLENLALQWEIFRDKHNSYIRLFTYTGYLIGWSYYLLN